MPRVSSAPPAARRSRTAAAPAPVPAKKTRAKATARPIPPSANQETVLRAVDMPLSQVQELASMGLTSEQIGYFFGLHPWSLELYRRQRPELNEALERGRSHGIEHAAHALRRQINRGNIAAIIFYLKSRGKWREIHTMELTGKDGEAIQFESKTDKLDLSKLDESELMSVLAVLNKAAEKLEKPVPKFPLPSDVEDGDDEF